MLTIKIPIWISSAYVTMRITSLPGSANRLPYLAAPVPIIAQRAALCQFLPAAQLKSRPVCLTKRLRGAILMSVRTAAIAVAVVPVVSFELEGNAAYRYGGRLFLMSEGRYDQRRKTDEHQRICKHICICDHIAHPLFREVDNLPFLPTHPAYHAMRPLSISAFSAAPFGRLFYPLRKI